MLEAVALQDLDDPALPYAVLPMPAAPNPAR